MADMNPQLHYPDYEDLDPDKIDITLDVDLDELMILFYGPERVHSVHPWNQVLSTLEDPATGELVGVSLSRFAQQVLVERPEAIYLAMASTILAGDEIFEPEDIEALLSRRRGRNPFMTGVKAAIDAWRSYPEPSSPRPSKREAYAAFLQIA